MQPRSSANAAGASQVSKFIIALCRDAGMSSVAIVRRDVHNELLEELGATAVLNRADPNFASDLANPGELIFKHKEICGFWLTPWLTKTPLEEKLDIFGEVQARFGDGRWHTDVGATVKLDRVLPDLAGVLADPRGKVFIGP
ncbi:MAG: NADPH:quinone reductase-like Zn-dependent oxidoreductase [Verrucomicrobiales bacterium]|jgi:NADPH:quinone reductase-like Zn-dependent oxidoreductase